MGTQSHASTIWQAINTKAVPDGQGSPRIFGTFAFMAPSGSSWNLATRRRSTYTSMQEVGPRDQNSSQLQEHDTQTHGTPKPVVYGERPVISIISEPADNQPTSSSRPTPSISIAEFTDSSTQNGTELREIPQSLDANRATDPSSDLNRLATLDHPPPRPGNGDDDENDDWKDNSYHEGPMFNYARFIRFNSQLRIVTDSLNTWKDSYDENNDPDRFGNYLESTDLKQLHARRIEKRLKREMRLAVFAGCFVQFGTTGSSIIVAYYTQVKGLGCRSGSYLIYGLASVVVLALLAPVETLLHKASIIEVNPSISADSDLKKAKRYRKVAHHMHDLGHILAFFNMLWLLTSSLLEPIGVYNNCWCQSVYPQLRDKGWVVLFRSAQDLATAAGTPTGGGLNWSFVTWISATVFLYFVCERERKAKRRRAG